jgi:hypothetical protein
LPIILPNNLVNENYSYTWTINVAVRVGNKKLTNTNTSWMIKLTFLIRNNTMWLKIIYCLFSIKFLFHTEMWVFCSLYRKYRYTIK